jgi:hypothetical protein
LKRLSFPNQLKDLRIRQRHREFEEVAQFWDVCSTSDFQMGADTSKPPHSNQQILEILKMNKFDHLRKKTTVSIRKPDHPVSFWSFSGHFLGPVFK